MTTQTTEPFAGSPRWFELAAFTGVWKRETTLFRRYWVSTTFAAVVEPVIYLLAFGFGLGSLIAVMNGIPYIEFLGTGVVATSVLFTSAFSGMFQTFVRRKFQATYDAMLAAPVDVHELVTAEAGWIATKAGVYGCAPLVVAMFFGLDPAPGMLVVPLVGFLTGLGFGLFGIWCSAVVPSIDSFNYIISAVITPLFLVAGTFFPVDQLPGWAGAAAVINPLYHCVQLVRHAAFGFEPLLDVLHVGVLILFAVGMWLIAVRYMRKRLID
ncbi:lipooligosaccharide transport system permease protein [Halopolyspora algeriensis]|uniref:Transport permease protein n=1 Tax=Halopolyspora algeriensis TaxID=1500506 RepID=A0A368VJ65_9ACTN|nr:ABC transporter permease [Halopolyspora algeriensis]RCW39704.1 lipooligosaccharide transport system permease protein [Halopolyspora algeriensis]TQM54003.1 lipooligosaccharide transport system permease protein [Halopolyspora algeriensis]